MILKKLYKIKIKICKLGRGKLIKRNKNDKLNKFDLVAILTDHDNLDYEKILKHSKKILDCRGRFFNVSDKKVIQS